MLAQCISAKWSSDGPTASNIVIFIFTEERFTHRYLFHTWATLTIKGGPCMKQVTVVLLVYFFPNSFVSYSNMKYVGRGLLFQDWLIIRSRELRATDKK